MTIAWQSAALAGALALAGIAWCAPASAQQAAYTARPSPFSLEVELGARGTVAPRYEGSDDYRVLPAPIIRLRKFRLGSVDIDSTDPRGFSFYPAFRFVGSRRSSDVAGLPSLPGRDMSVEIGLGAAYETEYWRIFGELRYGAIGHDGFVGDVGVDAIFRPQDAFTLNLGPRLSFADDTYMDWTFGVPANIPALTSFDADGGLKSVGIEGLARYDLDSRWSLEAGARWDHLLNDAGKSPITAAGDDDQFRVTVGAVRRFSFGSPN
jgi:outer membrane protein